MLPPFIPPILHHNIIFLIHPHTTLSRRQYRNALQWVVTFKTVDNTSIWRSGECVRVTFPQCIDGGAAGDLARKERSFEGAIVVVGCAHDVAQDIDGVRAGDVRDALGTPGRVEGLGTIPGWGTDRGVFFPVCGGLLRRGGSGASADL